MVVATQVADRSRTAFGLLLLFNGVNLKLFVSNLFALVAVLLPPLHPELVSPTLFLGFGLMFLEGTLSVLGMACCVSSLVGTGFRVVAGTACAIMGASLIVTLGVFLPRLLRQRFAGGTADPTPAFTLGLVLGTVAHVLFFGFLWRLARCVGRDRLALWPIVFFVIALLIALLAALAALLEGEGIAMGIVWIGSSLLLCAHAYFLLVLREAVAASSAPSVS
jgi:hypothetical protein